MNPDAKEYSKVNVSIANDHNDPTPGFYRNFSFKRDNSSLGLFFDSKVPTQNFLVLRRIFSSIPTNIDVAEIEWTPTKVQIKMSIRLIQISTSCSLTNIAFGHYFVIMKMVFTAMESR